jgi:transcriptional regulator with GAF, ATPase, and Fis domain
VDEFGECDSDELIARAPAMLEAVEVARRAARARSTVLITGETGTGKELIAGLVHAHSPRREGPFVKVNCAALPETLLESELFGHERGAFTGADQRRIGRFEQASGGTLLLDEIAELSPPTQAKLLRVLQDQEFHRLGGTALLRTDARVLAATNRNLVDWLAEGSFRPDLYYRLNVIGIHLPPLRERPEDILDLAERFREQYARELDRSARCFSSGARRRIQAHRWPGNVRELRNAVERAVLMCDGSTIEAEDLALSDLGPDELGGGFSLRLPPDGIALEEIERMAVEEALRRSGYVQKDAAQLLRVTRRQLNYAIRRMGLTHPSWRKNRGDSSPRGG